MNSKIACIKREFIPVNYLNEKTVIPGKFIDVNKEFSKIEFIPRIEAENDWNFKQIIPYILLTTFDNKILIYQRNGNETRLKKIWSAGWGGHIEEKDYQNFKNVEDLFVKSAIRELKEEFSDKFNSKLDFLGLINEEITEVGKVHIGLVYSAKVDGKNIFFNKNEILQVKYINVEEINDYNFELWSLMAFELFNTNKL